MTRAGEQKPARTDRSRWQSFLVAMTMALLAVFAVAQMASAAEHCAPVTASAPAGHTHAHAEGHAHQHEGATTASSVTHQRPLAAADESLASTALSVCGAMILLLVGVALARLLRRSGQSLLTVLPRSWLPQPRLLLPQRPQWALSLDQLAISRT